MGNIGILAIGVVLIVAVLVIGYKMDTASNRTQARKAAKSIKDKSSKQIEDEYEYTDKEEADIYAEQNLYDMHYDSDDEEGYESDFVSPRDLAEEEEYEEDDISLFEKQSADEYTFNNDIDDELDFEIYDPEEKVNNYDEVPEYEETIEIEEEPEAEEVEFEGFTNASRPETEIEEEVELEEEPEPVKPKKTRGRPRKNKEEAPKATRGRKAKKEVESEPVVEEHDFSSTMIFDVDRLNAEIDSLDEDLAPREPEVEYSDAVDIDAKISELEDDDNFSEPIVDGPFKPVEEDAESFMDRINQMKEAASVDDFSGFSVDSKDEDIRDAHKKYTKRKTEEEINLMNDNQISFIQEPQETPTESVDIGFLAEMEKTLKQNQKDRMAKYKKKKEE